MYLVPSGTSPKSGFSQVNRAPSFTHAPLPSKSDHVVSITSNSQGCSDVGGTGQARPTLLRSSSQGWGGGGDTNP